MLIYLIGLPGVGKTTIGKQLAESLHYNFIDLDDEIEKSIGLNIPEIFNTRGEKYFREIEKLALHKTFNFTQTVVACGGGTPCFFDNLTQINKNGKSIYLKASSLEINSRLPLSELEKRPLFKTNSLDELLKKRKTFYEKATFNFLVSSKNIIDNILQSISK